MKKCPNCMKITDSKFCPDCGYDLSTVDTLVCPKCGTESNSRFCPNCGTNMLDSSETTIITDKSEVANKGDNYVGANSRVDNVNTGYENSRLSSDMRNVNDNTVKGIHDILKKKPVIIGAAIAVVLLLLIGSLGSNSNSSGSSSDVSTDTYSTVDESNQDSAIDYNDSSNGTTYSNSDDGLDLIQGTWKMVGVVTDGESTNVSGYSVGSLVINGDKWKMTISTSETTENSGTLYFDTSSVLDSGKKFYVYTMKSDGYSGSVKMAYSSEDDFIAVSTNSTLDSDNCMMFGR